MVLDRRRAHDRGMTHPRRLSFAVGTSLLTLTASLAIGCKPKIVNEGPHEPVHTNEGPVDEPEEPQVNEGPVDEPTEPDAEQPEDIGPSTVNTAHVPDPD